MILFKGIDNYGHTIVLFVCITPKNEYTNFQTALENFKLAGFKVPKLVILDQNVEFQEAFDKCNFKPEQIQICQNYIIKKLKRSLLPEKFSSGEVNKILKQFKKLIV